MSLCVLGLTLDEGGGDSIPPSHCSVQRIWERLLYLCFVTLGSFCFHFMFVHANGSVFQKFWSFFCLYLCNLLFPYVWIAAIPSQKHRVCQPPCPAQWSCQGTFHSGSPYHLVSTYIFHTNTLRLLILPCISLQNSFLFES